MRPWTPPTLRSFITPIPQDPLRNLNAIKSLGTSLAWWAHHLLDINKTRAKMTQAYRHTQRHMNNSWSEMFLCSLCFAIYCFSSFSLVRTNNMG